MQSFWKTLPLPIIGLSPMDGVTDHPYRHIYKKYGHPAVLYTEFTSVEGVCHGATSLLKDFLFDETQRPIVAQIYGTTPSYFQQTATILCQLGFDGIDINMGCPAKNVAHSGAGAALIKTPKLAQEIIQATKQGVIDWYNGKTAADCPDISTAIVQEVEARHAALPLMYQEKRMIPVSIKTRIGYDEPVIREWISNLLEMEPAVIAVHGRTLKQQYSGLAQWDHIQQAAELIKTTDTLVLGNGDIQDYAQALERVRTAKVDGVLLGRATFGNPFVLLPEVPANPSLFEIAVEHAELFEQTNNDHSSYAFLPMRKHLGWYIRSIPNASQIRVAVFKSNNATEVREIFTSFGLI